MADYNLREYIPVRAKVNRKHENGILANFIVLICLQDVSFSTPKPISDCSSE